MGEQITETTYKCPWCEYTHINLINSLRIHCQKKHKRSAQDLYDEIFEKKTCECGCGSVTKFRGLQIGYVRFCNGHNTRVDNHWGNNPEAHRKSGETRKKLYADGTLVAWSKGLTKESDERVRIRGEHGSQTIRSKPGELQKRSERMKRLRLSGEIPTVYGHDMSQWNDGVSSIKALAHSMLFKEWKFPKLVAAQFMCSKCQSSNNLNVHHDEIKMSDIVRMFVPIDGDPTFEEKIKFTDQIVKYHIENDVSGVVLCLDCHQKCHFVVKSQT